MKKIINLQRAEKVSKNLKTAGRTVVLVGGCFDLLHSGHLHFLEKAKAAGNILMVALENDANVKKLKGDNRPINPQTERAQLLAALYLVDYVILLPEISSFEGYKNLVRTVSPNIIAVTANDPQRRNKEQQAKVVDGTVKVVSPLLNTKSTTKLAKILIEENTL